MGGARSDELDSVEPDIDESAADLVELPSAVNAGVKSPVLSTAAAEGEGAPKLQWPEPDCCGVIADREALGLM